MIGPRASIRRTLNQETVTPAEQAADTTPIIDTEHLTPTDRQYIWGDLDHLPPEKVWG